MGGISAQDFVLYVRVQPGAKKTELVGLETISHPASHQPLTVLKLRLAAPPVDGKANQALCAFMAQLFAVPLRQVMLLSGDTSKLKRLQIISPQHIPALLQPLVAQGSHPE